MRWVRRLWTSTNPIMSPSALETVAKTSSLSSVPKPSTAKVSKPVVVGAFVGVAVVAARRRLGRNLLNMVRPSDQPIT